ncbi:MAG: DegT/DnrJ/EryC1/StrS family aminotransferase [Rhodospirillales bacterium]
MPSFGHLAAALKSCLISDDALFGPWRRENDRSFPFSRAAWALKTLVDAYEAAANKPNAVLWLPDYFCNQPLSPLRRTGETLRFYPVNERLEPDWAALEAYAESEPPNLFILVHYFGNPADTTAARSFCDRHGAALVEDATHCLMPTPGIGENGDYVLYSLYKHIPVPHGGLLIVRPSGAFLLDRLTAAFDALETSSPQPGVWLAKRALQMTLPFLMRFRSRPAFDDDALSDELYEGPQFGTTARRFLTAALEGLPDIASRRQRHERDMRKALAGIPGLAPLFAEATPDSVPYRAAFRADTPERAADCFTRLQKAGFLPEAWPDLPPEVKNAQHDHGTAIRLRRTVFLLPVDAAISTQDVRTALV